MIQKLWKINGLVDAALQTLSEELADAKVYLFIIDVSYLERTNEKRDGVAAASRHRARNSNALANPKEISKRIIVMVSLCCRCDRYDG